MNVLSLFDGMSCGQIALERAGIRVDNYFASEIDKYAIKITQKNYPDTIQLGDVNNWIDWHLPKIDLLIGGSPCQGFSNAGQGLNFDDPRSKLFFKFVDCLKWYKPTWFLLENVRMKKEWQNIISEHLGVEPIRINSALVSAQNRDRFYWTNIPNITQPEDKYILLKDIIENGEVDREKSYCIDANYFKGGSLKIYLEKSRRQIDNLSPLHQSEKRLMVKGAAIRNQVTKRGVEEQLNIRKDDKSNCVVPSYPHKLNGYVQVKTIPHGYMKEDIKFRDKYPSLVSQDPSTKYKIAQNNQEIIWRKLSCLECERLQTVPEGYTEEVSSTQRYKMLGNGWTVDVIAHIFSFIPKE